MLVIFDDDLIFQSSLFFKSNRTVVIRICIMINSKKWTDCKLCQIVWLNILEKKSLSFCSNCEFPRLWRNSKSLLDLMKTFQTGQSDLNSRRGSIWDCGRTLRDFVLNDFLKLNKVDGWREGDHRAYKFTEWAEKLINMYSHIYPIKKERIKKKKNFNSILSYLTLESGLVY